MRVQNQAMVRGRPPVFRHLTVPWVEPQPPGLPRRFEFQLKCGQWGCGSRRGVRRGGVWGEEGLEKVDEGFGCAGELGGVDNKRRWG